MLWLLLLWMFLCFAVFFRYERLSRNGTKGILANSYSTRTNPENKGECFCTRVCEENFSPSLVTFRFSGWKCNFFELAESFEAQIFINECGKAFNASISLKNKLWVFSSFLATHAESLFFMAVFERKKRDQVPLSDFFYEEYWNFELWANNMIKQKIPEQKCLSLHSLHLNEIIFAVVCIWLRLFTGEWRTDLRNASPLNEVLQKLPEKHFLLRLRR